MSLILSGDRLRLAEIKRDQLDALLPVFNSNPEYQLLTNGVPTITLADLQSTFDELSLPAAHWFVLSIQEQFIGVLHLLLESLHDGKSWIGLLLIHKHFQRKGYGKEALGVMERYLVSAGKTSVHVGVVAENEPALLFFGKAGYEQYRQVIAPVGRLTQPVLCLAKQIFP